MQPYLFRLVVVAITALLTRGSSPPPVLRFYGSVVYDNGVPLPGVQVQFWHTDANGSYDHPSSSNRGMALLSDFQYFGTATTDTPDGSFTFVTYRPGVYGTRPTHIHFKVWINSTNVLTSQFYFADETTSYSPLLQLDLVSHEDGSLSTNKTIVLASGDGGGEDSLPVTPSQQQGPFYPVVDFLDWDNDLTAVALVDGQTVTPDDSPPPGDAPRETTPSSAFPGRSFSTCWPVILLLGLVMLGLSQ